MNDPARQPVLLTIPEAAEMLRVSVRTVHNLLRGHDSIPFAKIGHRVLIARDDILRYVDRHTNRQGAH